MGHDASITIRRLTDDDVDAFRALRLRAVRDHPEAFLVSPEEEGARSDPLAGKDRDDDFVLGAFDGDALVGLLGVCRFFPHRAKGRHKALVWGVYVAPEARQRGVGKRLLNEGLQRIARADGVEMVQLGVGTQNTAARALYESAGFETFGVEPRAIKLGDRYVDEALMVRHL